MIHEVNDLPYSIKKVLESEKQRTGTVGSEVLLLALIKSKTSCSVILENYGITEKVINSQLNNLIILRKNNKEYTNKLIEIINVAQQAKEIENSKELFEDHLLFGLLVTPNSLAITLLERLNVDPSDLLEELDDIYKEDSKDNYLINITKLAKQKKLSPFIGKSELLNKLIRILSKKQKNNPMLIGSAGVGKSALVEGLAIKLLDINPSITLYRLDLGTIIAGTKYRGDLEERLLEAINKIKNPTSIVFIDEIHNIVGSGSSDGTLDIANILKPILSRNEIKCIGATTLDEYYKYIAKDKALSRRFQNVFIDEASQMETYKILKGIVYSYEQFHNVKYSNEIIKYIVEAASFLPNRRYPDKAIDILDEAGLYCIYDNRTIVQKEDVDKIIFESLGVNNKKINNYDNLKLNYKQLKKYFQIYFMNLGIRTTIMNLQTSSSNLDLILEDIKKVFKISSEAIITLDFSKFNESHSTSSLFGSPAGYVGYDDGGILSEHIIKFPLSIIVIKNYLKSALLIRGQIESIFELGKIIDSKGREIYFKNSIFIFLEEQNQNIIGYINNVSEERSKIHYYIDEVLYNTPINYYYDNKIKNIIQKYQNNNYLIDLKCNNISMETYNKILKVISNLDNFKENKKYSIYIENDEVCVK